MLAHARRMFGMILLCALSAAPAWSDIPDPPPPTNILYGLINSNSTLTVASPGPIYYVVGDLIVNPGVTLTIQPGVTLRFSANRDTLGGGNYLGLTELQVRGHLIAQGTVADSIRFLSTGDGRSEWGHVRVDVGADASFRYVVLNGASVGVNSAGASALVLSDMSVRDCQTAVAAIGGSVTARWLRVENCIVGIVCSGGVTGTIQASTLTGVGNGNGAGLVITPGIDTTPPDTGIVTPVVVREFGYGVLSIGANVRNVLALYNSFGFQDDSSGVLNYCTAVHNDVGFQVAGTVRNSIAASNGAGIRNPGCAFGLVEYVDSWANFTNLQNNCGYITVTNYESSNPFFLNPAQDDYRLAEGSIFESFSSTGGQIGAYGPHRGSSVADAPVGISGSSGLTVTVTPNPTRGRTVFACRLPKPGPAIAEVIDLSGRKVIELRSTANQSGLVSFQWDGLDARGSMAMPGMYYWRVMAGGAMATGRLVLIK